MSHSVNYDIDKQLRTMILNVANNNPAPRIGRVVSISDDLQFADIELGRGGTLPSVKCLGVPTLGAEILMVFIDGDMGDPRALCFEVPERVQTYKTYNIVRNGNFALTSGNNFKYWTGGMINTNEHLYGTQSCKLTTDLTLTSENINLTPIKNTNEAFTVSFLWKGGGFTLEALTEDGEVLTALPTRLGNKQKMDAVTEWSFQRYNYPLTEKRIKLRFKNNDTKDTFLDGIRIWKPDDYREWFPSQADITEGGVN